MGMFGETIPTAKFEKIGDIVSGTIVEMYQHHRTEFGTGIPMYWHNRKPTAGVETDPQTGKPNDPVTDPVIVLDTGTPDEYGETRRRLFVKGKAMVAAIQDARRAAKARDISEYGKLSCQWASGKGGQIGPPRVWKFEYEAPTKQGMFSEPAARQDDEEAPF